MSKRQFNHQFDQDKVQKPYKPKGQSMTVPDQALTVRQLLERQQAGFKFEGAIKAGEYFEDREVPLGFQDITEFEAWKEEQVQQIMAVDKKFKEVQKKRRDLEKEQKEKLSKPPEETPPKKEKDPQ